MSISNSLSAAANSRIKRADGINWAVQNGADIINNSWSSGVQHDAIDDAIDNALTEGRNGLGTIIIFSSGNGNADVSYPANSNENIISVGAMSPCGERKNPSSCDGEYWWGSNYGNELDIMAPGVLVPTTDRQGTNGYNPHDEDDPNYSDHTDYYSRFNGTSAAAPHIAGVAALILSVNPNLSVQEVNTIIETTAQKVGGYNYQTVAGRPNGAWHEEMGYGLVDAFAAVQMAQQFTNAELEEIDLVCYNGSTTISLTGNQDPVTWQVSSNVTILSSNNSSITVRASSSDATGNGWVRATLSNGVTLQEDFGVNQEENSRPLSVSVYRYEPNLIDISVSGGSGKTPYTVYLNETYRLTTNQNYFSLGYTHSGGRVEVRNQNFCGDGEDSAFYTGYFGGGYGYSAYPNPASESLTLERTTTGFEEIDTRQYQENDTYVLYNRQSEIVLKGEVSELAEIDVSRLNSGTYILKIYRGNHIIDTINIIIN